MVSYEEEIIVIKQKKYTVVGGPHIPREIGTTMTVGGLRSILEGLDDEDLLHIQFRSLDDKGMPCGTEFSVSKAIKQGEQP